MLVERWNRLAEVWRDHPEFRAAALRYASPQAHRDPASQALWPEVVYPLIELARWQRRFRSRAETLWDALVGRLFHVGDAGVELDRLLTRSVPAQVVAQIDDSVNLLARKPPPEEDEEDEEPAPADETDRLGPIAAGSLDMDELAADRARKEKGLIALADPDPIRFLQGQLHELWKEARQRPPGPGPARRPGRGQGRRPQAHSHRALPPGGRGLDPRQGRRPDRHPGHGQQADRDDHPLVPHHRLGRTGPILAVWLYRDNSLVIAHLDFQGTERYVLWHAPLSHQLKFDDPADLLRELQDLGLEPPDQLDIALSRRFRPRNTV